MMHPMTLPIFILLGVGLLLTGSGGKELPESEDKLDTNTVDGDPALPKSPKLLVIMLDGFRWDYYDQHKNELNAFDDWISEGVQAKWLEPVFPSLSYPNWHTISTGLFPENHGIIGNYMIDPRTEAVFVLDDDTSTKNPIWWQGAEPIWTTAAKEGKKVYLRYWSRCDVPFDGTLPAGDPTGYRPSPGVGAFKRTLNATLHKLRDNDLLMVYSEHIDNIGHQYGPESNDMTNALREMNRVLKWFQDELFDNYPDIEKELNIVILSDHGMIESGLESNMKHLNLDLEYDHVIKVLGGGGFVGISPVSRHSKEVYDRLKKMDEVDVYLKAEIPEEFHYKGSRLAQEILVVAKPGYNILGLPPQRSRYGSMETSKQIPPRLQLEIPRRGGSHGYANLTEMRGIFFAKGPEFQVSMTHPEIRMVDVYQILTRVLQIEARPNNGTWARVSGMFKNGATIHHLEPFLLTLICLILIKFNF